MLYALLRNLLRRVVLPQPAQQQQNLHVVRERVADKQAQDLWKPRARRSVRFWSGDLGVQQTEEVLVELMVEVLEKTWLSWSRCCRRRRSLGDRKDE